MLTHQRQELTIFKNKRNIDFESQLEKKFYLMFEFNDEIECYQEQPVKVETMFKGRKIIYIPDCLIYFRPVLNKKPLLIEIKYLTVKKLTKDLSYIPFWFSEIRDIMNKTRYSYNIRETRNAMIYLMNRGIKPTVKNLYKIFGMSFADKLI